MLPILLWRGCLAEIDQRHYGGQGTHSGPRFGMGASMNVIENRLAIACHSAWPGLKRYPGMVTLTAIVSSVDCGNVSTPRQNS